MDKKIKSQIFFYVILMQILFLLLAVFSSSIYESATGNKTGQSRFFNNPEIISVVVGLIVSLLFFERWKALERRVDDLSETPVDTLKSIQEFAQQEIKQQFEAIQNKAESLRASVSGLVEKHPWLEVINQREMIVESDSCRGILRTCYTLLQDEKYLHLFEYLEFCSRKGTSLDTRKEVTNLNGTADDFYELSLFCEIWLEDYYLGSQFLKRYIEQYPESSYILLPHYIRTLLRVGDLGKARSLSKTLRNRVYGADIIERLKLYLRMSMPVSRKYRWLAANVLFLSDLTLGQDKWLKKYDTDRNSQEFITFFPISQALYDAEILIQSAKFIEAREKLLALYNQQLKIEDTKDLCYLFSKMGDDSLSEEVHRRIDDLRDKGFGDFSFEKEKATSYHDITPEERKEIDEQLKKMRERKFRKQNLNKYKPKAGNEINTNEHEKDNPQREM